MKFKQFEFRLFPRLRNRKKKKTKFNHPDYPRDISLDKNSNLCQENFPCFYDNFAAETAISEQFPGYVLCRSNESMFDTFVNSSNDDACSKIFPFKELKIDIDSACSCAYCASFEGHGSSNQMTCEVFSGACLGTPNTIPKSRTRIKTNPWLPSPRSTPSPTGTYQHIDEFGDNENSNINRPNTLPLLTPYTSDYLKSEKYMASLNSLAEIPEHGIIHDGSSKKLYDSGGEYLYKSIRKKGKPIESESIIHSPLDSLLKDDSNYETDISGCSSPLNEFLKCVKYEIDFAYEKNADDLLENSSFPRDDSFNSIINIRTDIPDKVDVDVNDDKPTCVVKTEEDVDFTFGDSNNNMQESIDTGYGSVSPDSDFLSSDEEFGTNSDDRYLSKDLEDVPYDDEDSIEIPKVSESSNDVLEEFQKHSFSNQDTDQAPDSYLAKDKDSNIDFSETSDLEWDDEPLTQTLILEFPHTIPSQNELSIEDSLDSFQQPVKRYNSVKYRKNRAISSSEKECVCRRRRSRSLADIELSLDEKVVLLREEKTFVQRKIHEAILEERVREHQMKIFRLLSGDKKKKLIEQTLHSLKTRLEDQSARLQASYSTVLSLQNIYSKRRVNLINERIDQNDC